MIHLTRLNKQPVVVNSDLIKFVENTPDTVVTLVSGEKIVVAESVDQVLERIIQFRRLLMIRQANPGPPGPADPAPADEAGNGEG